MTRLVFSKTVLLVPLVASAALSLTACVAPAPYTQYPPPYASQPAYAQPAYAQPPAAQPAYAPPSDGYGTQYGTIAAIQPLGSAASPSGVAGTVVGALVGGVLGNQVGRGHGRDAATVVGALGGAVAGNAIGQQVGQPVGYRVDVRLSDGSGRSFDMQNPGDLHPGDRVRIDGNQIARY